MTRSTPRRLAVALLATSALTQPAYAQTDDILLEPIVIEGEGPLGPNDSIVAQRTATGSKTDTAILDVPAQVSVVTEEELEQRGVKTLEQALSYTASVSVNDYGGDNRYDFFRIRGFESSGLGVYRDGLAVRNLNFATARMEVYGLQRLEVLKGSTSTLFGLNGPGGLVNAITKRPQPVAFGEVYATVGEDHLETGFDFGAPLDADGVWTYRLTAKVQDSEEYEHMHDDRVYFAPALTWRPTDRTELTFLLNYTRNKGNSGNSTPLGGGLDTDVFFGEPDFNKLDTTERNIGYALSHDFGNGLTFRQNTRYSKLDFLLEQVYDASLDQFKSNGDPNVRPAYTIDADVERFGIDNQLQYDTAFGNIASRTLVGVDHTRDRLHERQQNGSAAWIDPRNPVYCNCVTLGDAFTTDIDQDVTGVYLQEELTFNDKWIATFGGRYDYIKTTSAYSYAADPLNKTDESFTGRFGLTYKATDELSLYANYSESFQPQTSSADAVPQEGEQYEVGVKYRPANSNALFSAAFFDLTQNNVSNFAGRDSSGNAIYRQIGEINVKGIEFEGKFELTDRLNFTAAYSFWDSELVDDGMDQNEGNRPGLTADHLASVWVDYTLPETDRMRELNLGAGMRVVGDRVGYIDPDGDQITTPVKLGGYAVFDAAVGYQLAENTALAVNVSNLFDREYMSSRNFSGTNGFYGERRTVHATLKYTW